MLHTKNIILLVCLCIAAFAIAGCGGSDEAPPPNPAIKSFVAIPSIVSPGQATTLSMDFTNGTGRIDNGVLSKITFGNATTIKPAADTLYTLTVANRIGVKVSQSAFVTVSPIQGKFSSSVGKTVDPRDNFTATLLPSGQVLLAGGGTGVALHYKRSAELYNPATDTFTPTGFMAYSSANHTATFLDPTKVTGPNAGRVLVTGGWDGFRAHNDAQLYNPATGTFTATGSMARVRCYHAATLLGNGKVLITGGYDGSVPLAAAELYDPSTGTFTTTGPMGAARYGHTATLLNNGKVLIAGGTPAGRLCELYDPATGTFAPAASMGFQRSFHTATLLSSLPNAKVLIAGGSPDTTAELYDPITGTFALTGDMTTVRTYHTATLLPDSRVLLTGGSDNTAEFYDPNTRTFAETLRPMKEARGQHAAILLHNVPNLYNLPDIVLVVGGTGARNRADLFR